MGRALVSGLASGGGKEQIKTALQGLAASYQSALAPIECDYSAPSSSPACCGSARRRRPSTKVDYGPISHKGLKKLGTASTSKKLPLQIGLIANQSGLQNAVKSASNPSSSSYGKYPSLSTLQSKYGASSSKRKGVVNAFKKQSVKATVDVTHLRVSATPTIGKAQKLFGTKWAVYKAKSGAHVALPVNTPKLPKGIKGNVDTVAGMRLQLTQRVVERADQRRRRRHADAHRHAGPRVHADDLPVGGGAPGAACSRTSS